MKAIFKYLIRVWLFTAVVSPVFMIIGAFIKGNNPGFGATIFLYIVSSFIALLYTLPFLGAGWIIIFVLHKLTKSIPLAKIVICILTIPASYIPLEILGHGKLQAEFDYDTFFSLSIYFVIGACFAIWKYPLEID